MKLNEILGIILIIIITAVILLSKSVESSVKPYSIYYEYSGTDTYIVAVGKNGIGICKK